MKRQRIEFDTVPGAEVPANSHAIVDELERALEQEGIQLSTCTSWDEEQLFILAKGSAKLALEAFLRLNEEAGAIILHEKQTDK